ncbi:hypothetical protein D3C77_659330 [compost metagenome]
MAEDHETYDRLGKVVVNALTQRTVIDKVFLRLDSQELASQGDSERCFGGAFRVDQKTPPIKSPYQSFLMEKIEGLTNRHAACAEELR